MPPRRYARSFYRSVRFTIVVAPALAGCLPQSSAPRDSAVREPIPVVATRPDEASDFTGPISSLRVEFSVLRFSAPKGSFSDPASPIWKSVQGPLPSAEKALALRDVGFNLVIGREADRAALTEAIAALEQAVDVRSNSDRVLPDAARPVEMELEQHRGQPALWYYNPQGGLTGRDFMDPRCQLIVSFYMRAERLGDVVLRVTPAIEEPPGPPRWQVNAAGRFVQVPQRRQTIFNALSVEVPIAEGGFLVLGPTKIVYDRPYLARPFFVQSAEARGGKKRWRESIYIISPIIRREGGLQHARPGESP